MQPVSLSIPPWMVGTAFLLAALAAAFRFGVEFRVKIHSRQRQKQAWRLLRDVARHRWADGRMLDRNGTTDHPSDGDDDDEPG